MKVIPTVCLCMIVKNEAHVLPRCFDSLKHLISYWVIADTGSTDDTRAVIQRELADIPGELHCDLWRDFSHNRNLVLERARGKAEWLIMHDADETLIGDFSGCDPSFDFYGFEMQVNEVRNKMVRIFRGDLAWSYHGEMHEHPVIEGRRAGYLRSLVNHSHADGARSKDPETPKRDAEILRSMPKTARNLFNLGQALRDANDHEGAIAAFDERVTMGEWAEERWLAMYFAAELDRSPRRLVACFNENPKRCEPLHLLAEEMRAISPGLAYVYAKHAAWMKPPKTALLAIRTDIYEWRALELCYLLAYQLDDYPEAYRACLELIKRGRCPGEVMARALKNIPLIEEHL